MRSALPILGVLSGCLLTGCYGGGTHDQTPPYVPAEPPPPPKIGVGNFVDSPVKGLRYVAREPNGLEMRGYTDEMGAFNFYQTSGATVAFSIGNVPLGSPVEIYGRTDSALGENRRDIVTPYDLTTNQTTVMNILRTLQALNVLPDARQRIEISSGVDQRAEGWSIDFSTTDLPSAVSAALADASSVDGIAHVLPSEADAKAHFNATMMCLMTGVYHGWFDYYDTTKTDIDYIGMLYSVVTPSGDFHAVLTGDGLKIQNALVDWLQGRVQLDFPEFPIELTYRATTTSPPVGATQFVYSLEYLTPRRIVGKIDSGAADESGRSLLGNWFSGQQEGLMALFEPTPMASMRFVGSNTTSSAFATYLSVRIRADGSIYASSLSPASALTTNRPRETELTGSMLGDTLSASGKTKLSEGQPQIEMHLRAELDRNTTTLTGGLYTVNAATGAEEVYFQFGPDRPLQGCIQ